MKNKTSPLIIILIVLFSLYNIIYSQRLSQRSSLGRSRRREKDGVESGMPSRDEPTYAHPNRLYGNYSPVDYERDYGSFGGYTAHNSRNQPSKPPSMGRGKPNGAHGTHSRWDGRYHSTYRR
jgi:hypothetical protein